VRAAEGALLPARSVVELDFSDRATLWAVLHPVTAMTYGEIAGEVGAVTLATEQPAPVTVKSLVVSEASVRASFVVNAKLSVASFVGVVVVAETAKVDAVRSMVTLFEVVS
jgi:hypothetical protein